MSKESLADTSTSSSVQLRNNKNKRFFKKNLLPYWLLLPTISILAVLTIFPLAYSIYVSFQRFNTFGEAVGFHGVNNYADVISSITFWNSLGITLLYTAGVVAVEMVLGLALALMVSKENKVMSYLRWILIIPMMLSPLVVGIVFRLMLNADFGIVNYMLTSIGLPAVDFLGNSLTAFLSIMLVDVWQWTPMCFLIALAGLQSLPQDPYEAARLDGASKWQILRDITIPLLKPVLIVALVIRTMDALRMFDQVFVLTQGGPGRATEVISFLMYRAAMRFSDFGFATAGLFMVLVVTILLSLIMIKLLNRTEKTGGY
ncbi:carbohydrate ABC transporter membrane protein 1, CUT1 family [Alteribacillus persepolensis]|uniref:Carbohydrate ABC transporter membrane protein 1, CUT1 family n=1 Tax=Alteribacillus persepolensis TaxID=568899 RepID=A0A1G8GKQ5_9BACI|nr:sugar ABC transporter permease [Alteribacillus persepolensis]SDH94887.1 carbohydrate ABC transporter membrane protein 1, CUT1 family [Alteribacillus persepolensis]